MNIIYEDNHIIVVEKPPGVLSQKDKTGDASLIQIIKDYIKVKYNKPGNVFLGSVHRLDRPTGGVMVFAKTSKALTRLNNTMKSDGFNKKYYAIVEGVIEQGGGELVHYLVKNTQKNIVSAYKKEQPGSKKAILKFNTIGILNGLTLVDIDLKTGRSHQIRTQLREEFYPIVGDKKYGSKTVLKDKSICLHSYNLSFIHPVKKELMSFNAFPDFNNQYWKIFANLIE